MAVYNYDICPNLVGKIIAGDEGSMIKSIFIDDNDTTKGTGFCNAALLNDNGKILMNVRHVEYSIFYTKKHKSSSQGSLSYYHDINKNQLVTNNYMCELDPETLTLKTFSLIDASNFNVEPKWDFVGLEDGRLAKWDDRLFLIGVRRDTTTNGVGRMEFSEIKDNAEVSRNRIEVEDNTSYCEKNWMPILDKPYHFVKWTNPTEVVKVDLDNNISKCIHLSKHKYDLPQDLRGGTPLIPWYDGTYLAIVHECYFIQSDEHGFKDSCYKHRFVIWDADLNVKCITRPFDFMMGEIEFCIGLCEYNDKLIISFGYYDNCLFALKVSKDYINNLIWTELTKKL